jgi:hypothetical protein
MTIYVLRSGNLVEKELFHVEQSTGFPMPRVSRFDAFESPVTGQSVSSWRQRDRDMQAVDAVDRRDIPQKNFEKRKKIVKRNARSDQSS